MSLTAKNLVVCFVVSTALFLALFLPPQLVIGQAFGGLVTYRSVTGSILSLRLSDGLISDFPFKQLELETSLFSLLTGAPKVKGRFSAPSGTGVFSAAINGETIAFEDLSVIYDVRSSSAFGVLSGVLRLRSENAVISMTDGCASGQFQLTSDLFANSLAEYGVEQPPLAGQAECAGNGMLVMELASQSDIIEIKVMGRLDTKQTWDNPKIAIGYTLTAPSGKSLPAPVHSLFDARGLQNSGSGYSGNLIVQPG